MKKICILCGVGLEVSDAAYKFIGKLKKRTGADCFIHKWNHCGAHPIDDRPGRLGFGFMKKRVYEIIMDYSYVIEHLNGLITDLPEADMYIGHSGGSLIVAGAPRPVVIMGSPLQLFTEVRVNMTGIMLNLLNARDPIAAQVDGATNVIVSARSLNTYFNPFAAHCGYWESKKSMGLIVDWFDTYAKG